MSVFGKLSTFEGILQFAERIVKWAPVVVGTALSSGITGWAVAATSAFDAYGPASWVIGGLVGAVLFFCGLARLGKRATKDNSV